MKFLLSALMVAGVFAGRVLVEQDASPSLAGVPKGWTAAGRSPPEEGIELLIAVKQTNLAKLETELMAVSDPRSERYGQHLSNAEVHQLVAPTAQSVNAVVEFLKTEGHQPTSLTSNSDFIQVSMSIAQAEALLNTQYYKFQGSSGQTVHRAFNYTLPSYVADAVDFVAPTVHIPPPSRSQPVQQSSKSSTAAAAPLIGNSPKHLRELYSVGDAVGKAPTNKMAVTAFLEQHIHVADLQEFYKIFCGGLVCGKGNVTLKGDETTGLSAGVESMLDIETITGVAGNISSEFWGFSGRSPDNKANEPFMKWLSLVSSTSDTDVPKVMSTSYGEDESSWSAAAASRMNTEFQKAGARGISILFASGDEGANCKGGKFVPETPGSSPWVTAVGGTQGGSSEEAIPLSSGGFSNRWAMPKYQAQAVSSYLSSASSLPDKSVGYNTSNRAYPDISAQASDFTVVANGIPLPGVAGTSCAAPTASGVIALLNDARLAAGKSTLGFLNPWIYQNSAAWNDITSGASEGCDSGRDGWPASKGWDAVTGCGTPNYAQLLKTLP
mmetsp:Transcript_50389/g.98765  ORF Transcript_50389/g.98765 Transcript_50389/m.98765 type:complete len:553 (-) Transcript_50389:1148-2806(-)|eukprot:CAMPEP_0175142408 /NCGR_PEP_ID=MMETSP0087-20121206/12785_1 /TAXON_ID=136419 /ORGANISM="Unknown Unknown, Strain D1" /LENGTH=552 /DNA_ID=CAMNT_0016426213 /DNA_START=32 /DNA_END=1690 /DNA_ORIENTATION=-